MHDAISGIVLAGGRGTRLGADKRAVVLLGVPLLERAVAILQSVADDVVIVTRDETGVFRRARILSDDVPDRGPVAGLLTGLRAIRHARAVVIPIDMPLLTARFLFYLSRVSMGWDITIPTWARRLEPLVGVYSTACAQLLERSLRRRRASVADFVRSADLPVRYLTDAEIMPFGDPAQLFLNVNRREDMETAEALLLEVPPHAADGNL
ncbi:MAG: molybdenum cofactor guanylyltransferase [Armatimonadetes bacterium]|nr:molybdenum cofactor guanylyltransferase [Armatimonadota bacterium]